MHGPLRHVSCGGGERQGGRGCGRSDTCQCSVPATNGFSFAALSMHRTGSLVAQRVLDYCDIAGQNFAIHALLSGKDCMRDQKRAFLFFRKTGTRLGSREYIAGLFVFGFRGSCDRHIQQYYTAPYQQMLDCIDFTKHQKHNISTFLELAHRLLFHQPRRVSRF